MVACSSVRRYGPVTSLGVVSLRAGHSSRRIGMLHHHPHYLPMEDVTRLNTPAGEETSNCSQSHTVPQDDLLCPICFDVLTFPVTLACGHNFDRGCLLSAWHHEHVATPSRNDEEDDESNLVKLRLHRCPLCRCANRAKETELHVNLLLQQLVAAQFPDEAEQATTVEKAEYVRPHPSEAVSSSTPRPSHNWRHTITSCLSVWAMSMVESPGFVLAVLLLIGLLAITLTPQHVLSNASTLSTVYESSDYFFGMLRLIFRNV